MRSTYDPGISGKSLVQIPDDKVDSGRGYLQLPTNLSLAERVLLTGQQVNFLANGRGEPLTKVVF